MNFADIYKYYIDDHLIIETNILFYSGIVSRKNENSITINGKYYKYFNITFNRNDIIFKINYSDIISIKLFKTRNYQVGSNVILNKQVFIKNELWGSYSQFENIVGKITEINTDPYTEYAYRCSFKDNSNVYDIIEIIPYFDAKKMYEPKKRKVDEKMITKFDKFILNEKLDIDELEEKYFDYLEQIKEGNFYNITDELFDIIKDNNWDEKSKSYDEEEWTYRKLKIKDVDEFGLIVYDESIVDKFNEFKKLLKLKFDKYYLYIDNENGIVYIIKANKE